MSGIEWTSLRDPRRQSAIKAAVLAALKTLEANGAESDGHAAITVAAYCVVHAAVNADRPLAVSIETMREVAEEIVISLRAHGGVDVVQGWAQTQQLPCDKPKSVGDA